MQLTPLEARVIGCLMEKQVTTPDQYPLSLNSLTLACNQKSSREPVMSLTEAEVEEITNDLVKKRLVSEQSGFGSRVVKYQHRFCNTEFSELTLSQAEYALVCVLLLRGPQTPGELKTRTNRLYDFADTQAVDTLLVSLAMREKPFIAQLAKEAGKRDCRYLELFSGDLDAFDVNQTDDLEVSDKTNKGIAEQQRISELEARIEALELRLSKLEANQ